jgi:predicted GIY-YIG superfamily endonuclease
MLTSGKHFYALTENILCLHHEQPVEDALRRGHQQSRPPGARAQTWNRSSFASKYKLDRLVYFERFEDIHNAIEREKRIKGWLRIKKIALIVSVNPAWRDLSLEWYERHQFQPVSAVAQGNITSSNPLKLSS